MGKFNLNQILSDASRQAAEGGDVKPRPTESRIEKLSVYDLVPSEDNFYSMREIEELKAAIEIAGKVLQNLVVVPLDGGKYKVIAGHRRRLASISLVEEGKPQYEFVPCDIEPNEEAAEDQEIRDGFMLIATNSQREKTAWDRIEEVRYLRDVLEKARTKPRFVALLRQIVATAFNGGDVQADGTRDFIAKVLHTSPSQVGRFDTIIRHLGPDFMRELKEDRINISTAYELAGLSPEEQADAFAEYQRAGEISIKAARVRKREAPPAAEDSAPPSPPAPQPHAAENEEPPGTPDIWIPANQEVGHASTPEDEAGRKWWDRTASNNHAGAGEEQETPADGPQSAQDGQKPPAAEKNMDSPKPPTAAAEEPEQAAAGNATPTAEEQPEAPHGDAWAAEQLESLRAYCQSMANSDTDDGSRVWELDVDALDLAISHLRRG